MGDFRWKPGYLIMATLHTTLSARPIMLGLGVGEARRAGGLLSGTRFNLGENLMKGVRLMICYRRRDLADLFAGVLTG